MNCKIIHKNLIFYLDGELSPEETKKTEEHLKECQSCYAFTEEMKKTLGIIQAEKITEVNPFIYTRIKTRLENQGTTVTKAARKPVYQRILQPVVIAAGLFVGIYTGIEIGHAPYRNEMKTLVAEQGLVPYIDEMKTEPLENFIINQDGNEEN
jgi:predicted anti-sigma-YlaC factor YlaD